jgi:HSP20 family protein
MAQFRLNIPDLWSEMGRLHHELNRVFGPTNGPKAAGQPMPAVNVWDDEQNVYAQADLPGIAPENLEILVTEGNQLTIQGERSVVQPPNAVWHRQERGFGKFVRHVTLPSLVDADKVEAKYEFGVLYLTLPKSEAAKPRKIVVKSQENTQTK